MSLMYQSNRSINIPPPPSRANPSGLNIWRLACSNSLPSGLKSCSNAPPISTEIPLLKDNFCLLSNTVHDFQREICHNDTFKHLLNTLIKELFTNKDEILSCKSVKPCKNRKNAQEFYARTRDKSGSNYSPIQGDLQILPFLGTMHSQMPWGWGGGWNFNLTDILGVHTWTQQTLLQHQRQEPIFQRVMEDN